MIKDRNLTILSEAEKFALYGFPDFNNKQRREYFSFSEKEFLFITQSQNLHINVYCALQVGYFKAKKTFEKMSQQNLIQEDLQFIVDHYFHDKTITKIAVTKHEYYAQRKTIADFFGYQLWSTKFSQTLYAQAAQIIKRDTAPNFIARELLAFLDVHKSQNRIESYHQLRAAIAKVGGKKQLYGKTDIDVEISNECGRLDCNSVIYYNSVILSEFAKKHENIIKNKKFITMLKKISPVAWHHHIHFLGQYTFQGKRHLININQILEKIELHLDLTS